jgi:hypothetical protein
MGILFIPQMFSVWSHSGMILTRETEEFGEELVAVPVCPPQIPHGLTQALLQEASD